MFGMLEVLEMKEKQEGEIMKEAKGKERGWEKRGWERTCKSGWWEHI